MIRLLVADDHPIVRQRLRQLLLEDFPSADIAEAHDTASLVTLALSAEWDIIVSDLAMPGGGGLVALEQVVKQKPGLPVVIISTYPEEQYASRVIAAGAFAFVSKDNAETQLAEIIRKALNIK